jgi:hypothetical protein
MKCASPLAGPPAGGSDADCSGAGEGAGAGGGAGVGLGAAEVGGGGETGVGGAIGCTVGGRTGVGDGAGAAAGGGNALTLTSPDLPGAAGVDGAPTEGGSTRTVPVRMVKGACRWLNSAKVATSTPYCRETL